MNSLNVGVCQLTSSAPPFHASGKQPQAPCPRCVEKGDDASKDLYGIRGLGEGQMDAVIPQEWLQCPAIKLDGSVPGMEAVRVSIILHAVL